MQGKAVFAHSRDVTADHAEGTPLVALVSVEFHVTLEAVTEKPEESVRQDQNKRKNMSRLRGKKQEGIMIYGQDVSENDVEEQNKKNFPAHVVQRNGVALFDEWSRGGGRGLGGQGGQVVVFC